MERNKISKRRRNKSIREHKVSLFSYSITNMNNYRVAKSIHRIRTLQNKVQVRSNLFILRFPLTLLRTWNVHDTTSRLRMFLKRSKSRCRTFTVVEERGTSYDSYDSIDRSEKVKRDTKI